MSQGISASNSPGDVWNAYKVVRRDLLRKPLTNRTTVLEKYNDIYRPFLSIEHGENCDVNQNILDGDKETTNILSHELRPLRLKTTPRTLHKSRKNESSTSNERIRINKDNKIPPNANENTDKDFPAQIKFVSFTKDQQSKLPSFDHLNVKKTEEDETNSKCKHSDKRLKPAVKGLSTEAHLNRKKNKNFSFESKPIGTDKFNKLRTTDKSDRARKEIHNLLRPSSKKQTQDKMNTEISRYSSGQEAESTLKQRLEDLRAQKENTSRNKYYCLIGNGSFHIKTTNSPMKTDDEKSSKCVLNPKESGTSNSSWKLPSINIPKEIENPTITLNSKLKNKSSWERGAINQLDTKRSKISNDSDNRTRNNKFKRLSMGLKPYTYSPYFSGFDSSGKPIPAVGLRKRKKYKKLLYDSRHSNHIVEERIDIDTTLPRSQSKMNCIPPLSQPGTNNISCANDFPPPYVEPRVSMLNNTLRSTLPTKSDNPNSTLPQTSKLLGTREGDVNRRSYLPTPAAASSTTTPEMKHETNFISNQNKIEASSKLDCESPPFSSSVLGRKTPDMKPLESNPSSRRDIILKRKQTSIPITTFPENTSHQNTSRSAGRTRLATIKEHSKLSRTPKSKRNENYPQSKEIKKRKTGNLHNKSVPSGRQHTMNKGIIKHGVGDKGKSKNPMPCRESNHCNVSYYYKPPTKKQEDDKELRPVSMFQMP